MRTNNKKILGALTVAGVVAMTGSAFTAGGLNNADAQGDAYFVGGQVEQAVTGGEQIQSITYDYTDGGSSTSKQWAFNTITVVLADALDQDAELRFTLAAYAGDVSDQVCSPNADNPSTEEIDEARTVFTCATPGGAGAENLTLTVAPAQV